MKPPERAKTSSIFANEALRHLLAFSFAALILEFYLLYNTDVRGPLIPYFPFLAALIFLICCILEHIFSLFVPGTISMIFSIIPSLVLLFMLRRFSVLPALWAAIILAALLRLILIPVTKGRYFLLSIVIVLDIAALYLYFFENSLHGDLFYEKIFCICLVLLTLYTGQSLFLKKESSPFPIHFFLCVGILASLISMNKSPIDWTPVVRLGEKIAEGLERAADNTSYYFSSAFGNNYSTGYSSLSANGGKLEHSDREQLILQTDSMPYRTYKNEETGSYEKVRKTLYLTGGIGADSAQFISFLEFLYQNNVDKDTASLFSETATIGIEYVYLDTFDEIAPQTAFLLTEWDRQIKTGVSSALHKKGYHTNAVYLDIDYASPYFTELLRSGNDAESLDYESACAYAKELWDIDLKNIMSEEEYDNALLEKDIKDKYLDVTGADTRLIALADEITQGCATDYDKCRQIEAFLRQYSYSTDSEGGYDENSDMSSPKGMADISNRFLFDTGEGYCVHFTSSMVMLLRLSGIPARAVTGYRYAFPFEKEDEYLVNSSCAHVWPQAYIEGAGWLPFEPTSAYYSQTESSWHKAPATLEEEKDMSLKDVPKAYVKPQPDDDAEGSFATNSLIAIKVLWPFIVSAILLILLLISGTRLFRYLRYRFASPTRQLLIDVEQIKKALVKASGQQIYDRGLLSDYIQLAPNNMQSDLKEVFNTCYRMLYSVGKEISPTPAENALAKRVREQLERAKK